MFYGFPMSFGLAVRQLLAIHLPLDKSQGWFLSYDFKYSSCQ